MTRHRDDDAEEEADVEMETRRDVDDGNESEDAPGASSKSDRFCLAWRAMS